MPVPPLERKFLNLTTFHIALENLTAYESNSTRCKYTFNLYSFATWINQYLEWDESLLVEGLVLLPCFLVLSHHFAVPVLLWIHLDLFAYQQLVFHPIVLSPCNCLLFYLKICLFLILYKGVLAPLQVVPPAVPWIGQWVTLSQVVAQEEEEDLKRNI